MTGLLKDDVVIITGAAGGIGRALAIGLAEHGAAVAAVDLDLERAEEVAQAIEEAGGRAVGIGCDVTDAGQCQEAVAVASERLGRISVLVNNAGVHVPGPFMADDFEKRWRLAMDINLGGSMYMTRACLDELTATRGRIINMCSIRSFIGAVDGAAYGVSKGGLAQLTRTLSVELAPLGIRVNALAPGMVATEMTARTRAMPEKLARFLLRVPMKRVGEPEEMVGAVVFLASPLSSYVTGVLLPVDGGFLSGAG